MTRSREQEPEPGPALLTVSREQFAIELDARINVGDELLAREINSPEELAAALDAEGWDADLHGSGVHLLYGTARPRLDTPGLRAPAPP